MVAYRPNIRPVPTYRINSIKPDPSIGDWSGSLDKSGLCDLPWSASYPIFLTCQKNSSGDRESKRSRSDRWKPSWPGRYRIESWLTRNWKIIYQYPNNTTSTRPMPGRFPINAISNRSIVQSNSIATRSLYMTIHERTRLRHNPCLVQLSH